jgi:hypothetical protein
MAETVKVPFEPDFSKASRSVDDFADRMTKSFSRATLAFSGVAINQTLELVQKLGRALQAPIQAAIESEEAIRELSDALASSGRFSETAAQNLEAFAESLEQTSKFTDESILKSTSLLATLTKLDEQGLKRATQTAVDLAAALGVDLDTATRKVIDATQGGSIVLKGQTIQFEKTASASDTAARAIDQLASIVGGRAASQTQSLGGSLTQLGKALGNITEEFGKALTGGGEFTDLVQTATGFAQGFANAIRNNASTISSAFKIIVEAGSLFLGIFAAAKFQGIIQSVVAFGSSLGALNIPLIALAAAVTKIGIEFVKLVDRFGSVENAFSAVGIGFSQILREIQRGIYTTVQFVLEQFSKIPGVGKYLKSSLNSIDEALLDVDKSTLKLVQSLDAMEKKDPTRKLSGDFSQLRGDVSGAAKAIDKELIKSLEDLEKQFKNAGTSQLDRIEKNAEEASKKAREIAEKDIRLAERAYELTKQIGIQKESELQKEKDKLQKEQRQTELEEIKRQKDRIKSLASGEINEIITEIQIEGKLKALDIGAIGSSLTQIISRGAQGAIPLVAGALGAAANTIAPGLGLVASEFITVLAQGPEKAREMVNQFFDGLITLPGIIIETIFPLIETFVERVGPALETMTAKITESADGLIARIPSVIDKLVEQAPRIVEALAGLMPEIANSLAISLITRADEIMISLGKAMVNTVIGGFERIINGFIRVINKIPGVDLGEVSLPKLAQGGRIPQGFNNDSFPALLSSGEQVIDRSLTKQLEEFLSNRSSSEGASVNQIIQALDQQSSKAVTVNLVIGEEQLANAILNLNRRGFRLS